MPDLAERMKREIDQRLKEDYGKEEGLVSRQVKATIEVIADYLNSVCVVNDLKDTDDNLSPWERTRNK